MTDKICPKCGSVETMMFADNLGELFKKESEPFLPRGDSLHAGIKIHPTGPPLIPFYCDSCGIWFAIFCLPSKGDED